MHDCGAPPSVYAVAARGGRRLEGKHGEAPPRLQRRDEIQVFHYGNIRHATDLLEHRAPDKEGLIAIGQFEDRDAHAYSPFDDTLREAPLVETQSKRTPHHSRILQCAAHGPRPIGRETGVGMQEENDFALAPRDPRPQLPRPAPLRMQHPSPGRAGSLRGRVAAPAIDHDDLDAGCRGTRNGLFDMGGLVERGYHHRDLHGRTIARHARRPAHLFCKTSHLGGISIDRPVPLPYLCRVNSSSHSDRPDETEDREVEDSATDSTAPLYARAGVDLDHDESFIDEVKDIVRTTTRPEVLSSIGGFAGMFKAPERYRNPVFVAATDGVGTKLKLAAQIGRFDTVGIDCVAMVVNDLVVQGAEPVVFLDYIAMGKLERKLAADALRGIAEGCKRAGCALLGGETATMPGVYPKGEIEIVGFSVGVVERDQIIDGSTIREGDVLVGIASSGFHSNGYSLVRQVLDQGIQAGHTDLFAPNKEMNTTLASALLAPTRIYVKPVLNLARDFTLNGIVHVTGGGFEGNVPRVLPQGTRARIDPKAWPRPGVYGWLQEQAEIPESELLRVFNCGIGMILVVPRDQLDEITSRLSGLGERAYLIGEIERKGEDEPPLLLDPGCLEGN